MPPRITRLQSSRAKKEPKKPEFTRFKTAKHFFDQKRLELIDKLPATHNFRKRVTRGAGRLKQPPPPDQPRLPYPPDEIWDMTTKKADKKEPTVSDPVWCLRRKQLLVMWNMDLCTKRQVRDQARCGSKMKKLARRYKVFEYMNHENDTDRFE